MNKLFTIALLPLVQLGCTVPGNFNSQPASGIVVPTNGPYELTPYGDGVARLDTRTGQMLLVNSRGALRVLQDGNVEDPQAEAQSADEAAKASALLAEEAKLKSLQTIDGEFPLSHFSFWYKLDYKWRDGKILYRYSFGPYVESLDKARKALAPTISIGFNDSDGFPVAQAPTTLNNASILMGSDSPAMWMVQGDIPCPREGYLQIANSEYGWSFSKEFTDALKDAAPKGKEIIAKKFDEIKGYIDKGYLKGKAFSYLDDFIIYMDRSDGTSGLQDRPYPKANWDALISMGSFNESKAIAGAAQSGTPSQDSTQTPASAPDFQQVPIR